MFLKAKLIVTISSGNITSNSLIFTFLKPRGNDFSSNPETVYSQPITSSLNLAMRYGVLKRDKTRRNESATNTKR